MQAKFSWRIRSTTRFGKSRRVISLPLSLATDDLAPAIARLRAVVQSSAATPNERKAQLEVTEILLQLADLQTDAPGFALAMAAAESVIASGWTEKPAQAIESSASLGSTLNRTGHFSDSARLGRVTLDQVAKL